ncbi:MAG: diguanylate cyclase [Magnetococcales bacterium]|nr:diguanylate cyclase [Magnetococcales bacterium]
METSQARLERLLEILSADIPETSEALALVKEWMVKGPCAVEMESHRQVLAETFQALVKPPLTGHPEAQSQVDHLLGRLSRPGELPVRALKDLIASLKPTLAQHGMDVASTEELFEKLTQLFARVAEQESWVAEELTRLNQESHAQPGRPPLEAASAIIRRLLTSEDVSLDAWRQEREQLTASLAQVAESFHSTLSSLGEADGEVSRLAARVADGGDPSDMEALRDLLIREAGLFQEHATTLRSEITESQNRMTALRGRLEQVTEELQESRDNALHDSATGLPNRFAFSAHFKRNQQRQRRNNTPFAVILIHLHRLQEPLNTLDKSRERRLMAACATRIRSKARKSDFLARLDATRFAILLPASAGSVVKGVAEEMSRMLGHTRFKIGGSSLSPGDRVSWIDVPPDWSEKRVLEALVGFTSPNEAASEPSSRQERGA